MTFIIKNISFFTLFIQIFFQLIQAQRYCNGYENYCNKSYKDVAFAVTHNSYAVGSSYSANQDLPIEQQLSDGIRGLMLDVYPYEDGTIHLCHTKCSNPMYLDAGNAVEILQTITNFIQQNPNEVITIFIENYNGNIPAYQISEIFTSSGLIKYVYTPTTPGEWPTLGEMIDAQQNVVVFTDKLFDPAYPWYLSLDEYVTYTNYVSLQNEDWNCDIYGGSGNLLLLYHMKHVQILDKGYIPDTTIIDKTNSFDVINEHAQHCSKRVSFVAVDYYNHGDIMEYITLLNGNSYVSNKPLENVTSGAEKIRFIKYFNIFVILFLIYLFI